MKRYQVQLRTVLPRLSDRSRSFFERETLHDGTVRSFSIVETKDSPPETIAEFIVDDGYRSGQRFTLRYLGVSEIGMRHTEERLLFPADGSIFTQWGYDEVGLDSKGRITHSILFASGMEVEIACRDFEWKKEAQPAGPDQRR